MRRRAFFGAVGAALAAVALPVRSVRPRRVLLQESPVAGFQYHHGERLWRHLRPGGPLRLVREPDNRYDRRAVRVEWRGRQLGYVPRSENAAVAQLLDRGEHLAAEIDRLRDGRSPWERVRMRIWLEV
jgi:hypothetical protein